MEYKDYYKILGVDRKASQKDIQRAFRKLARQYHPDVNSGDKKAEARFKEINEANEVLSDPEKRKKYDQLGSRWKEYEQWQRAAGGAGAGAASASPFDWGAFGFGRPGTRYATRTVGEDDISGLFGGGQSFSDFFQTFFGGGPATRKRSSGTRAARQGENVEQTIDVTLEEAFSGTTRIVELSDSRGQPRRIEVKIPAGVRDGSRIRVAGQGGPGAGGGARGDLYLVTRMLPHAHFERRGDDLFERVSVPLTTAVLGGEAEVRTMKGKVMLRIPAGTEDGRLFRLRGQGLPSLERSGATGDLLAEVHVQLPTSLSARERELFEALRDEERGQPRAKAS